MAGDKHIVVRKYSIRGAGRGLSVRAGLVLIWAAGDGGNGVKNNGVAGCGDHCPDWRCVCLRYLFNFRRNKRRLSMAMASSDRGGMTAAAMADLYETYERWRAAAA
jgi:hypothetical protein